MKLTDFRNRFGRPAMAAALLAAFPLTAANSAPSPTPNTTLAPASTTPGATPVPVDLTKLSAALQAQHLATLKTRGDAEIARRLKNLNDASSKIAGLTTLTASDKSALTTQVQNEISGLTALKAKLDADTTLSAGRTDVQSIVTEYRVYLLMLPKVHLVAATDHLSNALNNLSLLSGNLQTAITAQKDKGKDVTAMQTSLTDMQAKTSAAGSILSGLADKLLALTPSDYNTNHTVLMQYRASLGTAQADLKAARADAASIIKALGGTPAASVSPSASPAGQ